MTIKLIFIIGFVVLQLISVLIAKKKELDKKRRLEEQGWQRGGTPPSEAEADEETDLYDIFEEEKPGPTSRPPTSAPRQSTEQAPVRVPPPMVRVERMPSSAPIPVPMPPRPQQPSPVPAREPSVRTPRLSSVRNSRGTSQRDKDNAKRAAERAASRQARRDLALARGTRGTVAAKNARFAKATDAAARKEAARLATRSASAASLAGKNANSTASAAAQGLSTAAAVRAILADPTRVRSAFVTAEILRPPSESSRG